MSVMTGSVVYTATVDSAPSYPAKNIAITSGSGTISDVKPGMRVVIKASGGDYKGTLHVRAAGTISASNIPAREFSKGFVHVASGDTLEVYDDFFITDKLVAADETFAPDSLAYSDQGSNPPPLTASGGWWAGWLSDADAIPFAGSATINLDPDTADTITHAWSCPVGIFSSSTAADPTLDLSGESAGRYLVTHAATAVNAKTRSQYIAVRAHDANDPPCPVTMEGPLNADPLTGWTASVRVYENADIDTIPDGAPVVLWADETIAGSTQSFGNAVSGRHHIKCAGYLRRDTSGYDANEGRHYVRFEIVSPLQKLNELPGFSKVLITDATPDKWSEVKTLTTKRAKAQLVAFYTNLIEAGFDFIFATGYINHTYPRLYLQKNTPVEQWRELADAVDAWITCDRVGRVEVQHRLELLTEASRAAVTETLSLTTADLIDYVMEREHYMPVETFRLRGLTAASSPDALFAKWPGAAPGMGSSSDVTEGIIAADASDIYDRCALRGAWRNRQYTDSDGVLHHAPRMTITLPGSYDCFDLYREFVSVTFTGNLRGIAPSDFRWLVENISYEAGEDGAGRNVLTLQAATHGIVDHVEADDTPPTEPSSQFDEFDFSLPSDWFGALPLAPVLESDLTTGVQNIAIFIDDGTVWTGNIQAPSPTWTQKSISGSISGDWLQVAADPFCSAYSGAGASVDVYLLTTTGLYFIGDVSVSPTATLLHTLPKTNSANASLDASILVDGHVVVCARGSGAGGGSVVCSWRSSKAGSFTDTTVNSQSTNAAGNPGAFVSRVTPGRVFTSAAVLSTNMRGYYSDDYGATWNDATGSDVACITPDDRAPGEIFSPLDTGETYFFHGGSGYINNGHEFIRNPVSTGCSFGDADNIWRAGGYGIDWTRSRNLVSVPAEAAAIMAVVTNGSNYGVVYAADYITVASGSWTDVVAPGSGVNYRRCVLLDPDGAYSILWGLADAIAWVDIQGGTVSSRTGNLNTSSEIIGLVGI